MDTYENKYKEALERAKAMIKVAANQDEAIGFANTIFPELEESKDEKVEKAIFGMVYDSDNELWSSYDVTKSDVLAWLEKQGENCLVNFDEAEKEKYDFVSGQYIECRASFNEFKEDNSYWLEYVGNDNYIGRSDNILNQKFHITPRQLFTLFTWQHCPKEDSNVNDETNAPTGYGKYVDECLNEASKHFFSDGEDKYSVADLFYAGVRCGKSWLENQSEQKPAWSEEDERMLHTIIADFKGFIRDNTSTLESHFNECIDWLKSFKDRMQPKQEWNEEDSIRLQRIIDFLWYNRKGDTDTIYQQEQDIDWLKSLRPQNHWKPSDEQMEALWLYAEQNNYDGAVLTSLYNDLKKLKEE